MQSKNNSFTKKKKKYKKTRNIGKILKAMGEREIKK